MENRIAYLLAAGIQKGGAVLSEGNGMAEKRQSGIKWRSGGIAMVLILVEIIKNYKYYPYEKEQQKG